MFPTASLDSQLAGALAGFTFAGIVFLFGRNGPKNTQALGLFCAAFVALGFDSHLFATVSGSASDPLCARAWGEEMTAAGTLAVGAMAIITGISWLLASHLNSESEPGYSADNDRVAPSVNLGRMVPIMAYGVGVVATLLLAVTTYDYLTVTFPKHRLSLLALTSPVIVGISSGVLTVWRRIIRTHTRKYRSQVMISTTAARISAYSILFYAVTGPVLTGIIGHLGKNSWQPPSEWVVIPTIVTGLAFPVAVMIALIQAVSPLATKRARRYRWWRHPGRQPWTA